jgi:hypothetical protein
VAALGTQIVDDLDAALNNSPSLRKTLISSAATLAAGFRQSGSIKIVDNH